MPQQNGQAAGDAKRKSIMDAAIAEFNKGYAKASTDAIVKRAGVSKGLLFHYFGSKKDLFLTVYDYALETVMREFYELINQEQGDILERWRQIALLKMDLMQQHPSIFSFIGHASFPDSEDVQTEIVKRREVFVETTYPKIFKGIDRSLFREDIDPDIAVQIIIYTMEGYAQGEADASKTSEDYLSEYDKYLRDLNRFIAFFRKSFCKNSGED